MNYMGTQVSSQHTQKSAPKTLTHVEPLGLKTGSWAVLLDIKYSGKTPPTPTNEDAAEAMVGNPHPRVRNLRRSSDMTTSDDAVDKNEEV